MADKAQDPKEDLEFFRGVFSKLDGSEGAKAAGQYMTGGLQPAKGISVELGKGKISLEDLGAAPKKPTPKKGQDEFPF